MTDRSSAAAAARRRRAREVARRHHPDVGGDVDIYLAELARAEADAPPPDPTVVVRSGRWVRATRALRRARRRRRHAVRALRSRLPRGAPFARRYTTL